jgi:hypothetical protein
MGWQVSTVTEDMQHTVQQLKMGKHEKLLHTWIIPAIVKQDLVQIDRIDGPTENLSYTLAAIQSLDSGQIAR